MLSAMRLIFSIISRVFKSIKGDAYCLDKSLSTFALLGYSVDRGNMLARGMIKFRKPIFLGRHTKVQFKKQIRLGKFSTLHDNVCINALSRNGIIIGERVSIGRYSMLRCTVGLGMLGEGIIIEDDVGMGSGSYIGGWGGVRIRKNTIIGERFTVHSDNHKFNDLAKLIRLQGVEKMPVDIGENCWIGSNVTVLGGVNIGSGCVIGAGSIVLKDVPQDSIVVGNPGRVIRHRGAD
jgi:acetyltransferase-like isoleucine patch superfamily enzyme